MCGKKSNMLLFISCIITKAWNRAGVFTDTLLPLSKCMHFNVGVGGGRARVLYNKTSGFTHKCSGL